MTLSNEKYIISTELVCKSIKQHFCLTKKVLQVYPQYGKKFCEKHGLEFVAIESLLEHTAVLDVLKTAGLIIFAVEYCICLRQECATSLCENVELTEIWLKI
jgi:tRNA 2-selenouridine synthase SelU